MMMIDGWSAWAKTDSEHQERWHALPWHLLEVGAMAQALWEVALPQRSKNRFCSRIGITDDEAVRWVGFLAATHDFGKLSHRFQSMSPVQLARLHNLYGTGSVHDPSPGKALRHSLISYGLLVPLFEKEFGWDNRIATRYAQITAAHHGRFWNVDELESLNRPQQRQRMGLPDWSATHLQLFNDLRAAFSIDTELTTKLNATWTTDPAYPSYEDSLWLAGLISVADWIGSDERYFEFNPKPAELFDKALETARSAAHKALIYTGWASPPLSIDSSELETAIRTISDFVPRRSQSQAVELTRKLSAPGLTVIEIPMGWGKTEIAFWIAAHYAETADINGMYFALPTMATSDQLYDRVYNHLDAHVKASDRTRIVPLHLLHGMADLSVRDELPVSADTKDTLQNVAERLDRTSDPDANPKDEAVDSNSVVRRARWFTRKKHGLLARYGVGTVDQALMSVLLTPHLFVRMFGLSGKTVIFDEVHSYDVYMSSLFDRLLEFLGAMGSPVVILSATLPQHRTQQMLAAYAHGAGWNVSTKELAPYPRISAVDDSQIHSITVDPNPNDDPTTLRLEWYPSDAETMWDDLAARLKQELQQGGTVAVICNTVRSAQDCYVRLRQTFADNELTLFHARFRQRERATIQDRVLERFGKNAGKDGNQERPHLHIVIATQVIEQSLDLDFDLMVSMFAPTDLLLQRAGRLQRHRRWDEQRPAAFKNNPRLWLIGYEDADITDGPEFARGSKAVYGEYVLLRSWLALNGCEQITIPGDVESLIEATYGQEIHCPTEMQARLDKAFEIWRDDSLHDELAAESVRIPNLNQERASKRTNVLVSLSGIKHDPEDNPDAHKSRMALTRLGPPSVSLVVLTQEELAEIRRDGSTDEPLSLEQTRELLSYAVLVSSHDIVRETREFAIPAGWETSTHLRHHKLIVLDESGEAVIGNTSIRFDLTLGLLISRANGGVNG